MITSKTPFWIFLASVTISLAFQFQISESLLEVKSKKDKYESDNELLSYTSNLNQALGCPLHEHWDICSGNCERNCSNYGKPLVCPDICVGGCNCDRGYTRGPLGNCILATECPDTGKDVLWSETCGYNEHYSRCGALPRCQKTCSNYDRDVPCIVVCHSGCICNEGYVKGPEGNCIPVEQCAREIRFSLKQKVISREESDNELLSYTHLNQVLGCPLHEHWEFCTGNCERNCSNYGKPLMCPEICVGGCNCDRGYTRGPLGNCILATKCPDAKDHQKKDDEVRVCPKGEQYSFCQGLPSCQISCSDPFLPLFCAYTCVEGCVCERGSIRGPGGKCVEQCAELNDIESPREPVPASLKTPFLSVCPNEYVCNEKCKKRGETFGICLGPTSRECTCF